METNAILLVLRELLLWECSTGAGPQLRGVVNLLNDLLSEQGIPTIEY